MGVGGNIGEILVKIFFGRLATLVGVGGNIGEILVKIFFGRLATLVGVGGTASTSITSFYLPSGASPGR